MDSNFPTDEDLLTFQQDGLDYLYHLEPTQNNLFWVGNFKDEPKEGKEGDISSSVFGLPNSQFRIQSVEFGSDTIEFEYNPQLKQNLISAVNTTNSVTISWIDDYKRSIQQYHMKWLAQWYNRQADRLVNKRVNEKFRDCEIILFHYKDGSTSGVSTPVLACPVIEQIAKIKLKGLVPNNGAGNFSLNMNASGAGEAISYDYAVNAIDISFSQTSTGFGSEEFTTNGGVEKDMNKSWKTMYI